MYVLECDLPLVTYYCTDTSQLIFSHDLVGWLTGSSSGLSSIQVTTVSIGVSWMALPICSGPQQG